MRNFVLKSGKKLRKVFILCRSLGFVRKEILCKKVKIVLLKLWEAVGGFFSMEMGSGCKNGLMKISKKEKGRNFFFACVSSISIQIVHCFLFNRIMILRKELLKEMILSPEGKRLDFI